MSGFDLRVRSNFIYLPAPEEEFTTEEKKMMLEVEPHLDRLTRTELTAIAALFIVKGRQHHWKGMINEIIKSREMVEG